MNCTLKIIIPVFVSVVLAVVAGCDYPYALKGDDFFHGKKPEFRPGPEGGADLVEIKEGVDLTVYKMILMDPVTFHYESSAQYNAIPPDVRKDLRDAFQRAVVDALGNAYPIVDKPRPDALRVRVAITGIVPAVPAADTTHPPISVGGASMKAEILDSWTRERVGAVMDTKKGGRQKASENMDEWEHTREVFKFWAQRLRNWLDETHGKR